MMTETQDELYDIIIRATELHDTDILWHTDTETLYEAIRAMMERKDAEIARLKAQLVTTWQPVADGDFDCDCSDSECRNKYTVEADGIFLTISEGDDFLTVDLGSRRLCKQVTP